MKKAKTIFTNDFSEVNKRSNEVLGLFYFTVKQFKSPATCRGKCLVRFLKIGARNLPYTTKNIHQRENSKIKYFKYFVLFFQNGQMVFDLNNRKEKFIFSFS